MLANPYHPCMVYMGNGKAIMVGRKTCATICPDSKSVIVDESHGRNL